MGAVAGEGPCERGEDASAGPVGVEGCTGGGRGGGAALLHLPCPCDKGACAQEAGCYVGIEFTPCGKGQAVDGILRGGGKVALVALGWKGRPKGWFVAAWVVVAVKAPDRDDQDKGDPVNEEVLDGGPVWSRAVFIGHGCRRLSRFGQGALSVYWGTTKGRTHESCSSHVSFKYGVKAWC